MKKLFLVNYIEDISYIYIGDEYWATTLIFVL